MTDHPGRQHADEINRFWNAVVAGDPPGDEFALEAAEVQLIRSLQRAGAEAAADSPPDLAWARVWARIVAAESAPRTELHVLTIPASAVNANEHIATARPRPVVSPPRPWSRRLLNSLATAALIVLTVVGSLFAVGLRPLRPEPVQFAPAVVTALTPSDAILTETLLAERVLSLPAGHASIWVFVHHLQPGIAARSPDIVGTFLFAVEQGTIEITVSDDTRVLTAGESLVASSREGSVVRNIGDSEGEVVELQLVDAVATSAGANTATSLYSDPLGGNSDLPIQVGATLPAGSGTVTLERMMLPAAAALPSTVATGFDWVGVAAGRLGVTLNGDRLPFRWDLGEERTYGKFEQLPPIRAGTGVTLRNAGADPLVFYHLAIAPATGDVPGFTGLPAIATETLLDVPAASLSAGQASVSVGFNHLQPGTFRTWRETEGSSFFLVDRGAVAIQPADETHVLRKGEQLVLETSDGVTMHNLEANETRVMEVHLLAVVSASLGPADGLIRSPGA